MFYLIDLFCGAGGVSTGAAAAGYRVIACVNHDPNAIKSHEENHPECKHYTEDIRVLDLSEVVATVRDIRRREPNAIIGLWASLECTNFSRAKGGLPRNADSRTLAEHLIETENEQGQYEPRYIPLIDPDIIYIENVEEFMAWGPLDDNGKPISKDKGCDYVRWVQRITSEFGYRYYDYRILNAADFGAVQRRKRFFAQFAKPHVQISWPKPTHIDYRKKGAELTGLKRWEPVRQVLQLDEHGQSIFGRKRNLSDKTYERIYHGLVKFVAGGKEKLKQFIVNYQHSSSAESIDTPNGTLTTRDKYAFLTTYHGTGDNTHSIDGPSPTVPTKDSVSLITAEQFIMRDFSNGGHAQNINEPSGSVMPSPKMNLVTATPFVMDTQYNVSDSRCSSLDEPIGTQTAGRKHYYIVNPQYGSKGSSIDNPSPTLIARMDKAPPYLVMTEAGQTAICVEDSDTEHMIKIKQFMAMYGLHDVKMRLFFIPELLQIQGFPVDYKLHGTKAEQKKYIGNAVEVNQARVLLNSSISANEREQLAA